MVPWEYATFFFFVFFVRAYIGKTKIDLYVKKTGMASILIGMLGTIIGFATVGCFVIVLMDLGKADWCLDGFNICSDVQKVDGDNVMEACTDVQVVVCIVYPNREMKKREKHDTLLYLK